MTDLNNANFGLTVLLVEDDNALRAVMDRFLRFDFSVIAVASAEKAVDAIKLSQVGGPQISAVVSDWNIETRDDGSYVVEAAIAAGIPVVVVTGDAWHVRQPLLKYGSRGVNVPVLEKPFAAQTLRSVVLDMIIENNKQSDKRTEETR